VTFTWKDYARGQRVREMTLSGEEFLRRFLLHVLPDRFVRIRYYGLLANRHREQALALCREVLPGLRRGLSLSGGFGNPENRLALIAALIAGGLPPRRHPVSTPRKELAMSKVVAIMSVSLDGYVADLNDGVAEVFDWYVNSGDVEFHTGGSDPMTFKVSGPSAEHLRGLWSELGAVLTGRRTFDKAEGWGGNHAWGPAFVLTHHIPDGWPRPDSTVHFVTDGLESAVHQAKTAAAGKSVAVHGADTIQQLLNAGLLDEIHVDIAAVLLGSGIRLFDHLAGTPAVLGNPTVIVGAGVTHLRYPVRKA
jgi:dihydrofolate reductase